MQGRIASGESYDWYYASQSNRDNQIRTAITDGTYNKPWIYRPKDFKNWWSNQHFNRFAGVESAIPTSWQPQSKPIWFTEAGCPAIDKGSNAPNSFYDAKSGESGLPPYSGGQQDAQMQGAYLRAMQNYWSTSSQNPISSVYGAKMVDATRIFYWAWDARPFPAFPSKTEIWADGANYATGHWLNGRLGAVDLGDLVTAIAARFGFSDVDVSAMQGLVDGFVLDRPLSAREALEDVLKIFSIDVIETNGRLQFKSRKSADLIAITTDDLVEDENDKALLTQTRAQETELPYAVRMGYVESGLDYRSAAVAQTKLGTGSAREISVSIPASLGQPVAQSLVDVALAESWVARETATLKLPPHFANLDVGDVLSLNSGRWRITSIADGAARKIEAVAYDLSVYDPPPATDRKVTSSTPTLYGQADVVTMDLAWNKGAATAAPWLAVQATPWPSALALFKKTSASSFLFNRSLMQQATMATTLTDLPLGLTDRVDYRYALTVQMRQGALASIARDQLLNGANLAAIGDATSGYELIQFERADLIAANTYSLTGLLRGLGGSAPEMLPARLAGQNFVLLNDAVAQPNLSLAESALSNTWRLGPQSLDYGHASYVEFDFTGQLKALRPLPPVQLKSVTDAAGVNLSWIRQTRVDADSWDLAEVPLGETTEIYQLDVMSGSTIIRTVTLANPNYLYSTANITADFGSLPATLALRVAQMSTAIGQGATLERTINV